MPCPEAEAEAEVVLMADIMAGRLDLGVTTTAKVAEEEVTERRAVGAMGCLA